MSEILLMLIPPFGALYLRVLFLSVITNDWRPLLQLSLIVIIFWWLLQSCFGL